MFNVGGGEMLAIFLLALIVLGPDKLPNAARQAGKYLAEFRRMSNGFQQEIRSAMDLDQKPSGTMASTDAPSLPPLAPSATTDTPTVTPATSDSPTGPGTTPRSHGAVHIDGPSGSFG